MEDRHLPVANYRGPKGVNIAQMIYLHRLVIISGETPSTPPTLRCPQTGSMDPKTATLLTLLIIALQRTSSSATKNQKQFSPRCMFYVAMVHCLLENVSQTDPTLPITKFEGRTLKNTNSRTKAKMNTMLRFECTH